MSDAINEQQDAAFTAAKDGYELFGVHHDFPTPSRIRAADLMGKRWPMIGEEGIERAQQTGKYPGMLEDMIITFWLSGLKHSSEISAEEVKARAWTVERACITPKQALAEAMIWAEGNGLANNRGETYDAAYIVYWEIEKHERSVMFNLDVAGSGGSPPEDKKDFI